MPVYGLDRNEAPVFVGNAEDRGLATLSTLIEGNFLAKITMVQKDISKYNNLTLNHECSPKSKSRNSPKCSHICLMSRDIDVGTCVCPEGMQLDNITGTNCVWNQVCFGSQFQCNDKRCIDNEWKCDGFNDCVDGEDEAGCQQIKPCRDTDFTCEEDHSCIPLTWKCDGEPDCSDHSDEKGCALKTCSGKLQFKNQSYQNFHLEI